MRVPLRYTLAATAALVSSALAYDFTPERLITAPRPSSDIQVSPDRSHVIVPVSYSHLDGTPASHEVSIYPVSQRSSLNRGESTTHPHHTSDKAPVIPHLSWATWLDDEHILFVNDSQLYAAPLRSPLDWSKLASFPFPIAEDSLKIVDTLEEGVKRLLFTAEVYEDGTLEGVAKVETEANEEEWSRLKVYDGNNGAFFRHWDQWVRPKKRSQIFTTTLSGPGKTGRGWTLDQKKFTNLLNGTEINTPIPTFGGSGDWDVSTDGVVLITKALDLPQAWHTKSDVYHVSFKTGNIEKLSQGDHGAVSSPKFSPNGEFVAWLQMAKDGFESDRRVLQIFDLKTRKHKALLQDWDRSPNDILFSPNGNKIYLLTEDFQQTKVYVTDLPQGGTEVTLEFSPAQGSVSTFVPLSESAALISSSSYRSVSEVSLYEQGKKSLFPITSFTKSSKSSLEAIEWGKEPQMFHYPSPDFEGEERWGWIHYPRGYSSSDEKREKKKWPLLVLIHGGPEGAWTDSWSFRWHPEVFAASGHLVVTLNPTGSTGFGQKYQDRILNHWGSLPYRDIIAGVHYILGREKGGVDPERVAAAGASYGGYMVNWIQGHNDAGLFKALVCHDGIFSTSTGAFYPADELYFPESENGPGLPWELSPRSVYEKFSPERHTSHWNTPQLIIHGRRDYRLVESEGISAFNTLRRRGIDTRLLYFETEGHWVNDPRNSLKWHHEIFDWVNKYIGSGPQEVTEGSEGGLTVDGPTHDSKGKAEDGNGSGALTFQRR